MVMNYQQNFRNFYKAIPVSSELEMGNITVEYNGMPTYFHNQSKDEIYVKYFDIKTGLMPVTKYIRADREEEKPDKYEEKFTEINERIDSLVEKIGSKK